MRCVHYYNNGAADQPTWLSVHNSTENKYSGKPYIYYLELVNKTFIGVFSAEVKEYFGRTRVF